MTSENSTLAARPRTGGGSGQRRALGIALVLGLLAFASAWLMTPGTAAYIGQNPYAVRLNGPTRTVPCASTVTISASVKDAVTGQSIGQQSVLWSLSSSQSSQDQVNPSRTVTANDGTTSVQVSFGPVSGKRTVQAMVADFPATFTVTCQAPPGVTPVPTKAGATPKATAKPTLTPQPGQSAVPGQTTQPDQSTQPTDPFASTPADSVDPATGSSAPPTTAAIGEAATSPGPTAAADSAPGSTSSGRGIPPATILLGGLGIFAGAALLLWLAARRRPTNGQRRA